MFALPIPERIDESRFWASAAPIVPGRCWEWSGKRDRDGYGRVTIDGVTFRVHRIAYALAYGHLRQDRVVDHLCRNPGCVNPMHLEETTVQINTARGVGPCADRARARLRGLCINGHVIAEVGEHKQGRGMTCAQCGRDRARRYRARLAAAHPTTELARRLAAGRRRAADQ